MVLFCEECGERHVLSDDEARRVSGTTFPCRKCREPMAAPVVKDRRPAETACPRTEP
jgi:hypothetical protein